MRTNTQKVARAFKILEIALQHTGDDPIVHSQIEEMQIHTAGYAEPGYSGDLIATGNWNNVTAYNRKTHKFKVVNKAPERISKLLEKLGVELAWSDEWTTCDTCQKLVRITGDSYSWTRAYVEDEGHGAMCRECVAEDPEPHLEAIENDHSRAWTLENINPEDHGYILIKQEFEKGLYGGQSDDPAKIAASLRDMGITRFVFLIDAVGQFDMRFKVLVHKSQIAKFSDAAFSDAEITGPDPAVVMQNALMNIPPITSKQPGVEYHKVNSDGTVSSRIISPEDWVTKGIRE